MMARPPTTDPRPEVRGDRLLMSRAIAWVWLVGGALLAAILLLDRSVADAERLVQWGVVATALSGAAAAFVARALPMVVVEGMIATGTVLVGLVVLTGGEEAVAYAPFYLCLIIQACYFLPAARGAVQVLFVLASHPVFLATSDGPQRGAASYLVLTVTVLATAAFVLDVRRRIDALVTDLRSAALRDPLTGLLNRRGFMPVLEEQLAAAVERDDSLCLLSFDLDRFKELNDREGHEAGDRALVAVGQVLRQDTRLAAGAARIGGEEFALVLPGVGPAEATAVVHELRRGLAHARPGLTASFGLAGVPAGAVTAGDLLRAADAAMYDAKRAGRDRVACAEPVALDPMVDARPPVIERRRDPTHAADSFRHLAQRGTDDR